MGGGGSHERSAAKPSAGRSMRIRSGTATGGGGGGGGGGGAEGIDAAGGRFLPLLLLPPLPLPPLPPLPLPPLPPLLRGVRSASRARGASASISWPVAAPNGGHTRLLLPLPLLLRRTGLAGVAMSAAAAARGEEALRSLKRDARGGTGGGPCRPAASGVLMDSEGVKHLPCQPGKK
jgi:hypothetical protein